MKALRKLRAEDTHLELVEVEAPQAPDGWAVLDVRYTGICGTDLHIMHNNFPSWPPVTLGHELFGTVRSVTGPAGVGVGERVVCEPHSLADTTCHLCRRGLAHLCAAKRSPGWGIDGGMAEQMAAPSHLLHRVPDGVPDESAALCEPTAVVVTGFERCPIAPGSTVLVIGPGPIGMLSALVARAAGAGRVVLVGRASSGARLALAERLGLEVWDSGTVDVAERAHEITAGRGADYVVESSGAAAAVGLGIASLRRQGQLLVLGVSGSPTVDVPWGLAMNRAIDVTFSLSSSGSSWEAALALMARGAVDPAPLATPFALSDWRAAFTALEKRTVVKALIDPSR